MGRHVVIKYDAKKGKNVAIVAPSLEVAQELQAKYSKGKSKNKAQVMPVEASKKPAKKKAK